MSVLGKWTIQPRKPHLRFNDDSPGIGLQNISLEYPVQGSPNQTTQLTMNNLWNMFTDESFNGNLINRISTDNTGLLSCPLMAQMLPHTVGNVSIAQERVELNKQYKTWLQKNRPHLSENVLFTRLMVTLRNEVGTLYQGYNTGSYMQCIVPILDTFGSIDRSGLFNHWKYLTKIRAVDEHSALASKECADVVSHIQRFIKKSGGNIAKFERDIETFKGQYPRFAKKTSALIIDYIRKKPQTGFRGSQSDILKNLTESQIKTAYLLTLIINYEGKEKDFIIVLPLRQTILHIEVKDIVSLGRFKDNKDKAKEQLEDLKEWMNNAHSDIFKGWEYVGVLAFPSLRRADVVGKFDPPEHPYLIFQDDVDQGMNEWWSKMSKNIPLGDSGNKSESQGAYEEYVKRTIGLSKFGCDMRFGERECSRVVREQLLGENVGDVVPGNRANDRWPTVSGDVNTNFKNVPEDERIVLSTLLWSNEQNELLHNDPRMMITRSDFGTGKTLILKAKALEEAKDSSKQVFYISLASVNYKNSRSSYTKTRNVPAVFDVATKIQFQGTAVTFLDALDIKDMYQKDLHDQQQQTVNASNDSSDNDPNSITVDLSLIQRDQEEQEEDIFTMLEWLITTKYPHASFFIDEWGWTEDNTGVTTTLKTLVGKVTAKLWISIRVIGGRTSTTCENMDSALLPLQQNHGVVLYSLPIIMRTSASVTTAAESITIVKKRNVAEKVFVYFGKTLINAGGEMSSQLGKAIDTVPGIRPRVAHISATLKHFKRISQRIQVDSDDVMVMIVPEDFRYLNTLEKSVKEMNWLFVTYIFGNEKSDDGELKKFLDGGAKVLITDINTFTGMEATVVISFEETRMRGLRKLLQRIRHSPWDTICDIFKKFRRCLRSPMNTILKLYKSFIQRHYSPRDIMLRSSPQLFIVHIDDPVSYYALSNQEHFDDFGSSRSPVGHLVDLYCYCQFYLPIVCASKVIKMVRKCLRRSEAEGDFGVILTGITSYLFASALCVAMYYIIYYFTLMFGLMLTKSIAGNLGGCYIYFVIFMWFMYRL